MDGADEGVKKLRIWAREMKNVFGLLGERRGGRVCVCVDCELFVTVFFIRTIMRKNRFRF